MPKYKKKCWNFNFFENIFAFFSRQNCESWTLMPNIGVKLTDAVRVAIHWLAWLTLFNYDSDQIEELSFTHLLVVPSKKKTSSGESTYLKNKNDFSMFWPDSRFQTLVCRFFVYQRLFSNSFTDYSSFTHILVLLKKITSSGASTQFLRKINLLFYANRHFKS